jgi:hypothetical protein
MEKVYPNHLLFWIFYYLVTFVPWLAYLFAWAIRSGQSSNVDFLLLGWGIIHFTNLYGYINHKRFAYKNIWMFLFWGELSILVYHFIAQIVPLIQILFQQMFWFGIYDGHGGISLVSFVAFIIFIFPMYLAYFRYVYKSVSIWVSPNFKNGDDNFPRVKKSNNT